MQVEGYPTSIVATDPPRASQVSRLDWNIPVWMQKERKHQLADADQCHIWGKIKVLGDWNGEWFIIISAEYLGFVQQRI